MADTFSFSSQVTQETAPATGTAKSGGGGSGFYNLLETERHMKFQEFAKIIADVANTKPTKEDLRKEAQSLNQRLTSARSDKLLGAIMGAAGNPVGQVIATKATEDESLLSYMLDSLQNDPDQYMAIKKADILTKLAPFSQAAASLVASGGLGKAEAAMALAQQGQIGLGYAQINAQKGMAGAGGVTPMDYLMAYIGKDGGGSINDPIGKILAKQTEKMLKGN